MAESWRERVKRESREMDAALRGTLPSRKPDVDLRDELQALAQRPRFEEFTWMWGPAVSRRSRVLFRPLVLWSFSGLARNAKGDLFDAWKGSTAAPLEDWLRSVDEAGDVELTRRLYEWRLSSAPWRRQAESWREDVVRRFTSAASPAARFLELGKLDLRWMRLDARAAAALYRHDRAAARAFILSHLPEFGWLGEKRRDWSSLLEESRRGDPDFHFDLYRRIVDEKRWRLDVLSLCRSVSDAATLDGELERRHPRERLEGAAEVFHELVKARGRDAVPYVLRHLGSVVPRYGILVQREAKGLQGLLDAAEERGWLDLWASVLRTGATKELFDSEVRKLVRSTGVSAAETRARLVQIAGHGREAHFPGLSLAQVHPLQESTALELYGRFPDLVRGAFRMHAAPAWHDAYPKLVAAAIGASDAELVDFLASRAAIQTLSWGEARGWKETIDSLTAHYEALPEEEFVRRAAGALSRMPAFAVWSYDGLLQSNRLARLLFERSTAWYLRDARAVRDLLESPQIHVQVLAFRILGRDDARARELAASNADLLQAALFRPLHRRTRLVAFAALENASRRDEETARYLVDRMRSALALPASRYPMEALVGLIGKVLHLWPALRGPGERPRVFGEAGS